MPAIQYFGVLIPIIAISIPLVAVTGRFIVQPLVQALTHLTEARGRELSPEAIEHLARLEGRVEELERLLTHVVEEQEFQKALRSEIPAPPALPNARH